MATAQQILEQLLQDDAPTDVTREWEQALVLLAQLGRRSPKDPQWPLKRGLVLTRLGRRDEAVVALDGAARLSQQQGALATGIRACRLLLELDPAHDPTLERLVELLQEEQTGSRSRLRAIGAEVTQGGPSPRYGHASRLARTAPASWARALPEMAPSPSTRRITLDLIIPSRTTKKKRRGNVVVNSSGTRGDRARRYRRASLDDIPIILDQDTRADESIRQHDQEPDSPPLLPPVKLGRLRSPRRRFR